MPATSLVGKQTNEGTPGIQATYRKILNHVQSIEMRRKFIFPAFNIHCFRIIKFKEDEFRNASPASRDHNETKHHFPKFKTPYFLHAPQSLFQKQSRISQNSHGL